MTEGIDFKPIDLISIAEIERSQQERIDSFVSALRDISARFKLGHAILIYEIEIDGKARLGSLCNTELQDLSGLSGDLRAIELLGLGLMQFMQFGCPKLAIGCEAGLEAMHKRETK